MSSFYNFDIKIIEGDMLEDIYQFRYQVYVEQLGRKQKYANHVLKTIEEPLDENGFNIGAWRDKELVGTVRVNFAKDSDFDYYNELYQIPSFEQFTKKISIVTKLMVSQKYRKTPLSLLLALKCYELGCQHGVELNFIDCNKHLINKFLMLGYRHYTSEVFHSEFGWVTPLVLFNQDIQYLQKMKSPFVPICEKYHSPNQKISYSNNYFNLNSEELLNNLS